MTSTLSHPNTIAIYDYGRTDEGVFYYAMEYLDGMSLDSLVNSLGPQKPGSVIYILQQICGSLAEAHEVGLIHRDIKPANILRNRRAGMYDVVKVLDFGLVKSVQQQDVTLTVASQVVGTPQYLSPEGISDAAAVDARSDLYAVGAVGYYLLTGRPVFDGLGIMDLCRQHRQEQPAPPSKFSHFEISHELDHVILQCLAKNKVDRPQSAHQLSDLLSACSEAGQWTSESARLWWSEPLADSLLKGTRQFTPPAADETVFLNAAQQSTQPGS